FGQTAPDLVQMDKQIKSKQGELGKLRQEIKLYESRIAKKEQAEANELNRLFELEERISLTSRLITALAEELQQLDQGINLARMLIQRQENEITTLQQKLADRFVHIYKQRRASMLELILTSNNWNQATYRSKYLKVAADYDRYLTKKVKEEIDRLETRRKQLARDRVLKTNLLEEKESEEVRLRRSKQERQGQIDRIKKDRRNDERLLVQKRQAAVALERIVSGLEFDREARARALADMRKKRDLNEAADINFYKGKLPWPTTGNVTAQFGRQLNVELNTVTENTGIDIQAQAGAAVQSVLDGMVTTVTYLRGYGTIVIVDHGKDLYTVYTHVEDVETSEGKYVDQGEVIAHIGNVGSLDGAKLHFEVWTNRTKQNPEIWLTRPLYRQ
ncbi:murein hydrolase activator EnvC family protein, partial [Candidatus Neomarinimicrobiota bacterium]